MTAFPPPFLSDIGPPAFVLDAAVAAGWVVPALGTAYTRRVLDCMERATAAVPGSWAIDLADLVRTAERKGRRTAADVDAALNDLRSFRIVIDTESPLRWWPAVMAISRVRRMPVGKAAYLELARRLNLPLATEDPTLTRHATAGVTIFSP